MSIVTFVDAESEQLPASNTVIYTCPATSKYAQIVFGVCTAQTTDTLSVNLVQSGDTAVATNEYIDAKTITAGTPDPLTEVVGAILAPGDFISAIAANATRLNLKFGIKEVT